MCFIFYSALNSNDRVRKELCKCICVLFYTHAATCFNYMKWMDVMNSELSTLVARTHYKIACIEWDENAFTE